MDEATTTFTSLWEVSCDSTTVRRIMGYIGLRPHLHGPLARPWCDVRLSDCTDIGDNRLTFIARVTAKTSTLQGSTPEEQHHAICQRLEPLIRTLLSHQLLGHHVPDFALVPAA